jgi:hypothetical protein
MVTQLKHLGFNLKYWLLLAIAVGSLVLSWPVPAQAHCDSINGPVVTAAQTALDGGDVDLVLPYVKPEYEAELVAAFQHTLEVRQLGPEAKELADHYFFETAVRLHRAGEGAAYTGLKMETDHGPALAAADQALETGSLESVYATLDQALQPGVAETFEAVQMARLKATEEGTVVAQRERVEAELIFEKYVYELHNAALGQMLHAEGGETQANSTEAEGHTHDTGK